MADYADMIKALRNCVDCYCADCKYKHLQEPSNFVKCMNAMVNEAADAIEELQSQVNAFNFIRPIQMPLPQPPQEDET